MPSTPSTTFFVAPPMIVSLYGGGDEVRTSIADMIAFWCRHHGISLARSGVDDVLETKHDGHESFRFAKRIEHAATVTGVDCLLFDQAPLDRVIRNSVHVFSAARAQQSALGLDPTDPANLNLVIEPLGAGASAMAKLLRQEGIPITSIAPGPGASTTGQIVQALERHVTTRLRPKPAVDLEDHLEPVYGG